MLMPLARSAQKQDQQHIQVAISRIRQTAFGGPAMDRLLLHGWTFAYGWAAGGAGFTFPLIRRVHLKPGLDAGRTLAVMTHEMWHAYYYGAVLAASIEQEYIVESYALRLRDELGVPTPQVARARLESWLATPVEAKYEEIRHFSVWHYQRLPIDQPSGLRALYWALQQAVHIKELKLDNPERKAQRERLAGGYQANADADRKLAEEWRALEEEAWDGDDELTQGQEDTV